MTRILIFAKQPAPGRVKTRLISELGPEGAARMARRMLDWTVREALGTGLAVELCGDPDPASWYKPQPGIEFSAQGGGELGDRLGRAAKRAAKEGPLILVGSDCPALGRSRMAAAAAALERRDAVIHPAFDGGYVLLGVRRFDPTLFDGIAWSSSAVARQTIDRIGALGWSLEVGETLLDVDEPEDLPPRFARC